ncbi:MAG: endonuclease/exonuclease/phosphatase family protein [Mycobacterium sp.]
MSRFLTSGRRGASGKRRTVLAGGLGASVVGVLGVAGMYVSVHGHVTLALILLAPILCLGLPVSAALFVAARKPVAASVALVLTLILLVAVVPLYRASDTSALGSSVEVRFLSLNLRLGAADAETLTAVASARADVVAVQELTQEAVQRLSDAGMDDKFPHRVLVPHAGAGGAGLWSRFPLRDGARVPGFEMYFVRARVEIPSVVPDPVLAVVHLSAPWPQPVKDWREDMEVLPGAMADLARADDGVVVIAGDFNSTYQMYDFRRLLGDGYQDAAAQAGAGLLRTYPANSIIPPLLGVDHVLVRNATATSAQTRLIPGSDHMALLTTVRMPTDR